MDGLGLTREWTVVFMGGSCGVYRSDDLKKVIVDNGHLVILTERPDLPSTFEATVVGENGEVLESEEVVPHDVEIFPPGEWKYFKEKIV